MLGDSLHAGSATNEWNSGSVFLKAYDIFMRLKEKIKQRMIKTTDIAVFYFLITSPGVELLL